MTKENHSLISHMSPFQNRTRHLFTSSESRQHRTTVVTLTANTMGCAGLVSFDGERPLLPPPSPPHLPDKTGHQRRASKTQTAATAAAAGKPGKAEAGLECPLVAAGLPVLQSAGIQAEPLAPNFSSQIIMYLNKEINSGVETHFYRGREGMLGGHEYR